MLKAPQVRSLAGARSSLYRPGEGLRTSMGVVSCAVREGTSEDFARKLVHKKCIHFSVSCFSGLPATLTVLTMTEAAPQPTLELDRVGIAYPELAPLASNWSATLVPGVTLLFGDTGSGKTTLLRVLAGEQRASGRLVLAGVDLDRDERAYRDRVCWLASADDAHDQTIVSLLPA